MYVKLNDRTYLNKDKITRIKIDSVQDGIRIRFYEGANQVNRREWAPCPLVISLYTKFHYNRAFNQRENRADHR